MMQQQFRLGIHWLLFAAIFALSGCDRQESADKATTPESIATIADPQAQVLRLKQISKSWPESPRPRD